MYHRGFEDAERCAHGQLEVGENCLPDRFERLDVGGALGIRIQGRTPRDFKIAYYSPPHTLAPLIVCRTARSASRFVAGGWGTAARPTVVAGTRPRFGGIGVRPRHAAELVQTDVEHHLGLSELHAPPDRGARVLREEVVAQLAHHTVDHVVR